MTHKVVFIHLKPEAAIYVHSMYEVCSVGSPIIIAPILSTGIWPDHRGGGRAFYSLPVVINIGSTSIKAIEIRITVGRC